DITMKIPYSGTAQRPPILDGSNYAIWKVRMCVYIKSIDEKAWQRVLQGWNPPRRTDREGDFLLKPETDWNADETAASNMNNKTLNSIFTSLDSNMFSLVTNCVCAKQDWEKLQMHCEGSESVRRTKRRILTTQFENMRMEESETIDDYERRLRKIENEAIDLGDAISNERLVRKVLRSLPKRFQMKICAIDESKDTSILGLDELMSSLRTYELEMNFEKKDKGKFIALQVSNDSYNDFVDLTQGVNEYDLGDDSIALLTKQFGNYLKRMRDYKKPGQKPKVLNALAVGKPLRICGPEQNTISSKSQNHFQKEGKTLTISKKFESVKCHECTGFGHYANECPTRLCKGMCASLSDDEDEEGTEQGEEETHNALSVLVLQKKHSVVTGVTTLGHNTDQKNLYNDWILRNKTNSALTKENSELKASMARLEVVLSKKDLELGKVKEELGRANATLAKFNSSKTKLDSILMMGKDDRAGLGFYNSKFEVCESSQTVFVKENSNSASVPIAIPKEKPIPLKTQAPVQRKKQRKRRFVCHYCHKQGHIKPYCFKLRYDYMYWKTRQVLPSVLPTLNQNTAWKKNFEKKIWVPKAKSSCNVVNTSLKTNVAGSRSSDNCYQLGEYFACKFTNVDDLNLWHQKLGHANFKALKKLSQYDAVRGMPNLTSGVPYVCGDCQKGISHEYSAPKTPQQNGIAKRKNRTLQEMERVMMQLAKFDSKNDKCLFLGYALNSRAYRMFNLRTRTIIESINEVFYDYADLKGKTIEYNIHDLLDTVVPQTDSSVVTSVVPPKKSPSTALSPTLNMDEQSTEDQDDFEDEIQDAGHDVPSKIQKNHPTSQIIGDAQGRMQTRIKEKVDYQKMNGLVCMTSAYSQVRYSCFVSSIEPKNVGETLKDEFWVNAMHDELEQFVKNDVWILVPPPDHSNIIGTK
ncbi:uncharacterized protein, partial [Henckelia pumila]|uniref:uncharacterized protein n=1 Tax=Henckelia pumila TaxID=405737 RepID=UPI003C6DC7F0